MKAYSTLRIHLGDERLAKAALSALLPDNRCVPEGMVIDARVEGGTLVLKISVEGGSKSVLTLRNTLDEVLEMVALITSTLRRASTQREGELRSDA